MRKRVITILFSFVVVLSVLPFAAYAETGNLAASYTESSKSSDATSKNTSPDTENAAHSTVASEGVPTSNGTSETESVNKAKSQSEGEPRGTSESTSESASGISEPAKVKSKTPAASQAGSTRLGITPTWGGYPNGSNSAFVSFLTPTGNVHVQWILPPETIGTYPSVVSHQVISGDHVYFVRGNTLYKAQRATGKIVGQATLDSTLSHTTRPLVVNGLVVVATDDGHLTAFSLDSLERVWRSEDLSGASAYQTLETLTASHDGTSVVTGFTQMQSGKVSRGDFVCVDLTDGSIKWALRGSEEQKSSGYCGSGAAAAGTDFIVGNESGDVVLLDGKTGSVKSKLNLGSSVRAGVIPYQVNSETGDGTYITVTHDGTLHVFEKCGSELVARGSVKFAGSSSSTPTIAGGKAFVGGMVDLEDKGQSGVLSVINLDTLKIERTVHAGEGEVNGAPLVSQQGEKTYVYFTVNDPVGGVWRYVLGDSDVSGQNTSDRDALTHIYVPEDAYKNFGTSPVICDAQGNLYYTNNSGALFSLTADKEAPHDTGNSSDEKKPSDNSSQNNSSSDARDGNVPYTPRTESDMAGTVSTQTSTRSSRQSESHSTQEPESGTQGNSQENHAMNTSSETQRQGAASMNDSQKEESLPMRAILGGTTVIALMGIFSYLFISNRRSTFRNA
ncbi:PQQ-binding-like beta-propeller repeat protein [Lancefieldella rimae]|uniref:outer membrane protein assembly factor BamB family protein n=1 Tax=Lancefieldella rimae TaxID=1383 RepID=UPI001CAD2402|nr:PQQ-binding-like beta-propeller repeat protein [Lancefieldella rimae]MBF4804234.1 PQQ-binding-like beta-propeller repeat protein [Lancefieldella rimae]